MSAGLFVAIALLAGVASAVPADAAPADPAPAKIADGQAKAADGEVKAAGELVKEVGRCPPAPPSVPESAVKAGEIVVCVQRPQGYRLDPDVMEAKREIRGGGRPKRPDRMKDTSCAVVGAAGCIGAGAGINLIGAALTAAEMAARLSKGQEIGSMFVTDPQPTEYQLYLEAKQRREAKEAAKAAAAKVKAKAAGQAEGAQAKASPAQ
jgi:hypothetical protein